MLGYQDFLVAKFWFPEWDSSENAEQFEYLHVYAPYHKVKKGVLYPAVMLVGENGDTRVDPLHAHVMAAKLQWATGSDRPMILEYDTNSSHSKGLPISKRPRSG